MNNNAYAPITDNPMVLDLTDCTDWGDVHQRIRKTFGFPGYYGENWDAMWDCLTDAFGQEDARRVILVKGYGTMSKEMQDSCQAMKKVFSRLQQDYPGIVIRYL